MAQRRMRTRIAGPAHRPRHTPDPLGAFLKDPALDWDGWAISRPLARALWTCLEARRPARVLELGSGTSTLVLAAWAARTGAALTTLEHAPDHHARTQAALVRHGLEQTTALILASCTTADATGRRFYDHALEGPFDFVFVDGPPLEIGRHGVLPAVWLHLAPGWELWLKDANRRHEKEALAGWAQHHAFSTRIRQDDRRGVAVLAAAEPAPPPKPRRAVPTISGRHRTQGMTAPQNKPRFVDTAPRRGSGRVTVTIPSFDCRDHLRRAVDSILSQTYDDLRLVVVSDGEADPPWDLLDDIDDPRLLRFALPRNMGRYFVDDLVLTATPDSYYLIQDADDWSAPERLARLMEALCRDNAVASLSSGFRFDFRDGKPVRRGRESFASPDRTLGATYRHLSRHHGLFRADALRAMGGYYGGFRISYDMLIMNLMLMAGTLSYVDQPLYNRLVRPRSLTNCDETGMRSQARRDANHRLRLIYNLIFAEYRRHQAGSLSFQDFAARARQITGRGHSAEANALRDAEAARLRACLKMQDKALAPDPARPLLLSPDDPALGWGGWSPSRGGAEALARAVAAYTPRAMVELGSGSTTALLASHAASTGARLVSLEHDPARYLASRRQLAALGLLSAVDLRLAPLVDRTAPDGTAGPFFDTALEGPFDFALIDGPPMTAGRSLTLPMIEDHLAPGWQVWLHDGHRRHELDCVGLWRRLRSFSARLDDSDPRGFWVLSDAVPASVDATDARRIGISILTGGRPHLLDRTVAALDAAAPGLLEAAHVECLVNGGDPDSLGATDRIGFLDARHVHRGAMWPVGQATSFLMHHMSSADVDFVLHLEDDWEAAALEDGWLERALAILRHAPEIGQLRLRHHEDKVLPHHEITRRPIDWTDRAGYRTSSHAHFTFNPSLVRRSLLPRIFPAADEHAAQRAYLATRLGTAQLMPGVFRHIGQRESLVRRRAAAVA